MFVCVFVFVFVAFLLAVLRACAYSLRACRVVNSAEMYLYSVNSLVVCACLRVQRFQLAVILFAFRNRSLGRILELMGSLYARK